MNLVNDIYLNYKNSVTSCIKCHRPTKTNGRFDFCQEEEVGEAY